MTTRAVIGALLAVAAIAAVALPGGATGDDESQPYPTRQVRIMAPAAPGGGWDSTARAFQAASRAEKLDQGLEVHNVGGAGRHARALGAGLQGRRLGRRHPRRDPRAADGGSGAPRARRLGRGPRGLRRPPLTVILLLLALAAFILPNLPAMAGWRREPADARAED